ncbi:MAG: papain-like cysteine protease family protein [Pyrinomonadaceae bacterium]
MAYVVQNMTLIPQSLSDSCWYASTQMLIKWKEEKEQKSFAHLISPEFDAQCAKIRDDNKGIQNPQIMQMAKRIGLKHVPPMSPTPETIEGWLKQYGPLWVNGKTHIVVIAGIMWLPGLDHVLLVYDPWPVNVGKIEWRSLSDWYAMGSSVSTRDTSSSVELVFLYVPDDI